MAPRFAASVPLRVVTSFLLVVGPTLAEAAPHNDASAASASGHTAVAESSDPIAVDVLLLRERTLIGQVVGAGGKPTEGATVRLTLADGRTAEAKTNADGGFAFSGVRGVARLESQSTSLIARCWTKEAAPPTAAPAVLLVEEGEVARGQRYAAPGTQGFVSHSKKLFANPFFVAGVVGTAVAIPVAIHNSDDDDPAS